MQSIRSFAQFGMRFLIAAGSTGGVVSTIALILVGFIILPIPTFLLDIFLVVNIVLALLVLLRGLSLSEPVKLFSFPTILLFATLFRLALNVSSTRLILSRGMDEGNAAAGQVIGAFGEVVVRSDFAVGCVIFLLIAVVNFVVIAKGSARVAEVAARFVLDALPGKQLAIDADLRAGLISQQDASERRIALSQESQFYGAMDGAMKFVQGDAIAGLVIVFINAIGGIAIGTYNGQPIDEAVRTFGILAIGDGLVNIIPSLLMSLAAGVIVTHVASRSQRGSGGEMFLQLLADPNSIFLAGASLLIASLLPGIPFIPFFLVGASLAGVSIWVRREPGLSAGAPESALRLTESGARRIGQEGNVPGISWKESEISGTGGDLSDNSAGESDLNCSVVELDTGSLASYFSENEGAPAARKLYRELSEESFRLRGFRLPPLRIRENSGLGSGQYRILVRGQAVRSGVLQPRSVFVSLNASVLGALGIQVTGTAQHPVDRRAGSWVSTTASGIAAARKLGALVLSPSELLMYETSAAVYEVIEEVFGLNEVKELVSEMRRSHPQLVEEVLDKNVMSFAECTELLRRLIRERVNIRDLKLILEGVSEFAASHPDPEEDRQDWMNELHAFLRLVLSRSIVQDALGADNALRVFMLSTDAEEEFRSALPGWGGRRSKPPLEPDAAARLRENARRMFHPVLERGNLPVVVLCAADVRHAAHEFFVRQLGAVEWLRTLSFQELGDGVRPESVGVLDCA